MKKIPIQFEVNGKKYEKEVEYDKRLVDLLRDNLELTGTKEGCGQGECGSCTVIMDGKTVNSCLILAPQIDGSSILTVEGLKQNGELHPLQKSFLEHGAVQCGYCSPGFLMSAKYLLDNNPSPSREEIKEAVSGNICRCTGYKKIISAIEAAAKEVRSDE